MTFFKKLMGKKDRASNRKLVEKVELPEELTELGLSAGIYANEDPVDDKIRDLGKQATQHKKNKEWDEAIDCLIQAQELMSQTSTSYTIANKLRLAKYYMYAERYEQALAECSKFINKVLKDKKTRFEVKEFTNHDFVEVEKAYWLMSQITRKTGDDDSARLYTLSAMFFRSASIKMDENSLIHTEEDMLEILDSVIPKDFTRDDIIKLWAKSLM